jgi:2-oxoglutarate dehydrogenase E1 component
MSNGVSDQEFVSRANADYIEQIYRQYQSDPDSVDGRWAVFFAGLEASGNGGNGRQAAPAVAALPRTAAAHEPSIGTFDLIHSYREYGHLIANLDPLGHNNLAHPLLEPSEFGFGEADLDRVVDCSLFKGCERAKLQELIRMLRMTYCGTIGLEYSDIVDKAQRTWLEEHIEPNLNQPTLSRDDRKRTITALTAAERFEQFLHTKFVGQKRFSLEGGESLIPMLEEIIENAGGLGIEEAVLGMAHRGRLNVLAHILRKPYEMIFSEFEGAFLPADVQGDGDVKYHLGYSHNTVTRKGQKVHISLSSNPSHLEAINPVVQGIVRAKQNHLGDREGTRVLPILIHGDASFTGQGLVSETLSLSELEGYSTGGTIHIIINNQIGFTTSPPDYRFTPYPSDVAKEIQAPVFHVNGDDPEAAVHVARLAIAFRQRFKVDVIIDLLCYRRHGHNEADDPTFTQPVLYKEINAHRTTRDLYAERLLKDGALDEEELGRIEAELRETFDNALNYARDFAPRQQVFALGGLWKGMQWAGNDWSADTRVPKERLLQVMDGMRTVPQGFAPHPKVQKLMEQRAAMLGPDGQIDWGCAEMLAFGSLLLEGHMVRLSGQDTGRGTFSHRHAVLYDVNTNQRYVPLDHLSPDQGRFVVIDSMLSEAAVLGFEYGFSTADPRNLVVWEAQFGDFANGAQVAIDQFIVSGESKWQRMSGLVLLLPHGYEGQGPEHSSARLERFLQLSAENNIQVCNLTTPAQYFHALRRQLHRKFRKPLIVMSPKSLLRHKLAVSALGDLTDGTFRTVLPEIDRIDPAGVRRLVLCSGRIYYTLLAARRERGIDDIAVARVEQLYPVPNDDLQALIHSYPEVDEVLWAQEEPWNMGAWHSMYRRLLRLVPEKCIVSYAGRRAAASPAIGSYKKHQQEEADLVNNALGRRHAR